MPEPDLPYLRQQAEKLRNACTDLIGHYDQAIANPAHLGMVAWAPVGDWSEVPADVPILACNPAMELPVPGVLKGSRFYKETRNWVPLIIFTHWMPIPPLPKPETDQ